MRITSVAPAFRNYADANFGEGLREANLTE
jgi:hypothetical protein